MCHDLVEKFGWKIYQCSRRRSLVFQPHAEMLFFEIHGVVFGREIMNFTDVMMEILEGTNNLISWRSFNAKSRI